MTLCVTSFSFSLSSCDLERGSVAGAGTGGSAGVSAESAGRLLGALLVELGDLRGLSHSLEIDSDDAALV